MLENDFPDLFKVSITQGVYAILYSLGDAWLEFDHITFKTPQRCSDDDTVNNAILLGLV